MRFPFDGINLAQQRWPFPSFICPCLSNSGFSARLTAQSSSVRLYLLILGIAIQIIGTDRKCS